jgi:hypothetical protein
VASMALQLVMLFNEENHNVESLTKMKKCEENAYVKKKIGYLKAS